MAKPQLLLVDADSRQLRLLEVSLKSEGFNVTVAADGMDAWEKLAIAVPDILVTAARLPRMDGFEIVRRLRERADTASLPVIFLAADSQRDGRLRALELGVEDYLPRPVLVRELVARANVLLAKRLQHELSTPGTDRSLRYSGSLNEVGLVDLLQLIEEGRRSGVAHVTHGAHELVMHFRDGRVLDAVNGQLRGEEAVYRSLLWDSGQFELETGETDAEETITTSTEGLLSEGMRRLDEMGRVSEQLPAMAAVFDFQPEILLERLAEVPDEVNGILRLVDGVCSLSDLIDRSPFDDLSTLNILSKLFFEGILVQVAGPVAARPVNADVRSALQRGQLISNEVAPRASFRPSAPPLVELIGVTDATAPGSSSMSNAFADSPGTASNSSASAAATAAVQGPASVSTPLHVPGLKRTDPGIVSVAPMLMIGAASETSASARSAGKPLSRDTLRPGSLAAPPQSSLSFEARGLAEAPLPESSGLERAAPRMTFDTLIQGSPAIWLARNAKAEPEPSNFQVGSNSRLEAAHSSRFETTKALVSERKGDPDIEQPASQPADQAAEDAADPAHKEDAWEAAWQDADAGLVPPESDRKSNRGLAWWGILAAGIAGVVVVGGLAMRSPEERSQDAAAVSPAASYQALAQPSPLEAPSPARVEAVETPTPSANLAELALELPSTGTGEATAVASAVAMNVNPKPLVTKPAASPTARHLTPVSPKPAKATPREVLPSLDSPSASKRRPPTARFPAPGAN